MSLKHLLIFIVFLIPVFTHAQKKNDISIGRIDSIYSHVLKEYRKVWVYTPKKTNTSGKFPALYLLDGDGHFHSVTGIIQQLSQINGNSVLPEMMVIGVLNTDRVRDLTPTAAKRDIPFFRNSGGGPKFTLFLERELIPFIEKKYPATTYRTIVGHSIGGLTALNLLFDNPNLFNSFIAIDPTITWDNQMILRKAELQLGKKKFNNKKLFLSMSNTLKTGWDTAMARKDTSIYTKHTRSILSFTDLLKKDKHSDLNWNFVYYQNETHGSVPLISEYDGLRFIYNFYSYPSFDKLLGVKNLDSLFTTHYANVSKNLGYKVLPDEMTIMQMGYSFLENDAPDNAYDCFNLNYRNYPKSFKPSYTLADYYLFKKDTVKAIEFYTKSLSIKENISSREKLNKINKKKSNPKL